MGLSFRVWALVERLFATSFNTLHPILALMGHRPPCSSSDTKIALEFFHRRPQVEFERPRSRVLHMEFASRSQRSLRVTTAWALRDRAHSPQPRCIDLSINNNVGHMDACGPNSRASDCANARSPNLPTARHANRAPPRRDLSRRQQDSPTSARDMAVGLAGRQETRQSSWPSNTARTARGHFEDATQLEGARVVNKDSGAPSWSRTCAKAAATDAGLAHRWQWTGRPPVLLDLCLDRGEFVFAPGHQSHREPSRANRRATATPQSLDLH